MRFLCEIAFCPFWILVAINIDQDLTFCDISKVLPWKCHKMSNPDRTATPQMATRFQSSPKGSGIEATRSGIEEEELGGGGGVYKYTSRGDQLSTLKLTSDHKWPKAPYTSSIWSAPQKSILPETPRSGVSFEENSILRSRGWGETEPS